MLSSGLFTWGSNSGGGVPTPGVDYDPDPPLPTACTGALRPLVVSPGLPSLTPFPTFQEFLGLDDISFQKLLDNADTTKTDLR